MVSFRGTALFLWYDLNMTTMEETEWLRAAGGSVIGKIIYKYDQE
jgi:hypothetical protein